MLKVKAGNLQLMGLLFERHHRRLYGFLFHMTFHKETAEDMVQQAFYRMLKYRERFTGDGEFVHWMFAIARNVLIDNGKRKKLPLHANAVDDMADWVAGHTDLEEALNRKQNAANLQRAMLKLDDDDRALLSLSRFDELRNREIAGIMGISENTVKVRVHRAMQQLKQIYLKENMKEDTR